MDWQKNLRLFLTESNRIEGIVRLRPAELAAATEFLSREEIDAYALGRYVQVAQPNARLRSIHGLDVMVGNHLPIPGGPEVLKRLERLLHWANTENHDETAVWATHCLYETLHPFTDGNGRSGRLLWAWMMLRHGYQLQRQFLHQWYYQSLRYARPNYGPGTW